MENDVSMIVGVDKANPTKEKDCVKTRWSQKINRFYVLCIYDQAGKLDDHMYKNKIWGKHAHEVPTTISVFSEPGNSSTFIIWDTTYQQSEALFSKLRLEARNELILRIATNLVAYLIKEYETNVKTATTDHPDLKDPHFIEQLIQKFDAFLKTNTFLMNHAVWEEFCHWFETHLTEWILEDMEEVVGYEQMEKLSENELNDLFFTYLTENSSRNPEFLSRFTKIVNVYTQDWINRLISSMNTTFFSPEKIRELLGIPDEASAVTKKDITFTLIDQGNVLVMSNAPYQSVREVLSKKSFQREEAIPWPTARIHKGSIEGIVQMKPNGVTKQKATNDVLIQEAWAQAKALSEVVVDVYDGLCSFFLSTARYHKDTVEIYVDDLLAIRGLKPKLGGSGRRGGYETNQREQILKALSIIQDLWIDLDKAMIYEKGRPVQLQLQGRAFIFKDHKNREICIDEQLLERKLLFTVDEVFAKYLYGSGRQVALLPIQALHYNPYREAWEKKLTRYFSWRWRTQARRGDYSQPHKISTLLEATGEQLNERTPSRTRDRLEQAFDTLLRDGVIASWQYEKWDESIASSKGWARIWENTMVLIEPPEVIAEQYLSIGKNRKVQNEANAKAEPSVGKLNPEEITEQLRDRRKNMNLSLSELAEELEISASYLSNIERKIKVPSPKIQVRMMNWLQR
ncbi:helix-turn-helix transcriptional regulator [Sporosarcina sp. FSL K6-1522]|uniref:helix-turn-helix domain-containing protein n=1 Tax=Sporosarcina sp. FSL K6-1522 TaxID=2921554 RepID=UPI00315A5798